jgi:alpha-N-arabinofuranosidase
MKQALKMEELIRGHEAVMDKYDPQKKTALVVDEWGGWYETEPGTNPSFLFQQNTMRDAVLAGVTLNIFNNHCDRIRMANLAQMVNVLQAVILTDKEKIIMTPTYHVMEMYNVHQNAMMIPATIENVFYTEGNDSLPALSVSASRDSAGLTHISLVNVDPSKQHLARIRWQGMELKLDSGRVLRSQKIQDHNSFDEPEKVRPQTFNGAFIHENILNVELPPASVVVLTLHG